MMRCRFHILLPQITNIMPGPILSPILPSQGVRYEVGRGVQRGILVHQTTHITIKSRWAWPYKDEPPMNPFLARINESKGSRFGLLIVHSHCILPENVCTDEQVSGGVTCEFLSFGLTCNPVRLFLVAI